MAEDEVKDAVKEKAPRRKYRNDSWTEEQVAARKAELTVEAPPEGYVKLSELAKLCVIESIPISLMVKATGGDRAMHPPLDPIFQVVFVGRTRYLPGNVMTQGIELLKSEGFGKTARKPREKKEKPEGAEGAAPKGKKAKASVVDTTVAATPSGRSAGSVWGDPANPAK